MQPKRIMLPVDGSSHSQRAAKHAAELARAFGSKIILVHCHQSFPHFLGEPYFQEAVSKIISESEILVSAYRDHLHENEVEFEEHILEGPAGKVIPELAAQLKADMIVMGSRGLSDLTGLVLGSVTHKVLQQVECPVLVIK
jgi:nucleotide-binding universal stress UspA family protein